MDQTGKKLQIVAWLRDTDNNVYSLVLHVVVSLFFPQRSSRPMCLSSCRLSRPPWPFAPAFRVSLLRARVRECINFPACCLSSQRRCGRLWATTAAASSHGSMLLSSLVRVASRAMQVTGAWLGASTKPTPEKSRGRLWQQMLVDRVLLPIDNVLVGGMTKNSCVLRKQAARVKALVTSLRTLSALVTGSLVFRYIGSCDSSVFFDLWVKRRSILFLLQLVSVSVWH